MTRDDLLVIADDLQYLGRWGPDISDGDVRRGSAVLRRLLVEDAYGHGWRAIGRSRQPKLIGVDIATVVNANTLDDIVFALAAGANFRGVQVACMLMNKGTKAIGHLSPPLSPDGFPGEREFTLSEFLSSLSGAVYGKTFNRREVIKYIANVKGGVHLSAQQRKAEEKLVARLGKIEKKMTIHTTDGLLVETVAIGQAVGKSADALDFIRHVTTAI